MKQNYAEENLTNNLENFEHTGGEYYGITENCYKECVRSSRKTGRCIGKRGRKMQSNVTMVVGDRTVTVKSILNIMAAGIKCGTEVEVRCDGENEEADLKTLVDLIESGLGE